MTNSLLGGVTVVLVLVAVLVVVFVAGAAVGVYLINEALKKECGIMLLDRKFVWIGNLRPVRKGESDGAHHTPN